MAISSTIIPRFIEEFRNIKLEALKRDLHKLTPEELTVIKEELDFLLYNHCLGEQHE